MITYNELIKNINILLADDDDDYLTMTYDFLYYLGYNVDIARDGKQALDMLEKKDYQILLLDYFMPELNGEQVINEIRKTNQELVIILQTGFSGQKPPIETMQRLNIQNYHDKTEGVDRLNLELISAVKIFNQQNEIELTKYRTSAIGNLIASIAQEIKSDLLSVGAGIEITNMMIQDSSVRAQKENVEKLNKFYLTNKESLKRIDKVLTSIINQTNSSENSIMSDTDIMDIINIILSNESKSSEVILDLKVAIKSKGYIIGSINDTIFILCEIIKDLINLEEKGNKIEFVLTEDENNWYFNISCDKISELSKRKILVLKKLVVSIKDVNMLYTEEKISLVMKKVKA